VPCNTAPANCIVKESASGEVAQASQGRPRPPGGKALTGRARWTGQCGEGRRQLGEAIKEGRGAPSRLLRLRARTHCTSAPPRVSAMSAELCATVPKQPL
jgi:hypothetical protein